MSKAGFGSPAHLAGRFFTSLWPGGPSAEKEAWALAKLLPAEQDLWRRMSGPDRRHAVGVAGRSLALLRQERGAEPAREVVAAALLHDVGKVEASFGAFSRAAVTLAAIALGRGSLCRGSGSAATAGGGAGVSRTQSKIGRLRHRVALYLAHDEVGAALLEQAGSDEFTVQWARQHHLPAERWTLDATLARALKDADGD